MQEARTMRGAKPSVATRPMGLSDYIVGFVIVLAVFWPQRLELAGHGVTFYLMLFVLLLLALLNYHIELSPVSRYVVPVVAALALCLVFVYHLEFRPCAEYIAFRAVPIIAACTFAATKQRFLYLVDVTLGLSTLFAVLTFVESATETNVFDVISGSYVEYYGANDYRFGLPRVRSWTSISINYCMNLVLISSLALYRVATAARKVPFVVCYVCILISAVLTFSRSALFMLIIVNIALALLGGLIRNPKRLLVVVGIIFFFLVYLYLFASDEVRQTVQNAFDMFAAMFSDDAEERIAQVEDSNVGGEGDRLDLFNEVMKQMPGYEVMGKGHEASFSYFRADGTLKESLENAFLSMYFHYGIVGFLGIMVWLLWCLFYFFKRRNNSLEDDKHLPFTLVAALGMVCFMACGLSAAFGSDSSRVLGLFIGLAFAYCSLVEGDTPAVDGAARSKPWLFNARGASPDQAAPNEPRRDSE